MFYHNKFTPSAQTPVENYQRIAFKTPNLLFITINLFLHSRQTYALRSARFSAQWDHRQSMDATK